MLKPFTLSPCHSRASCSLILLAALLPLPASAATYTAYPGSSVIVKAISSQITGPSQDTSFTLGSSASLSLPLLGGIILLSGQAGYACALEREISNVDSWRGIKVNSNGIMAGLTGTILNGVAHYQLPGTEVRTQITGGLSFNSLGIATAIGNAEDYYATRLCGAVTLPVGTRVSTPGNVAWGNQFADLDLTMWIYIPSNIAPGQYTLSPVGVVQGSSPGYSATYAAYIPIIESGDIVEVLPPPCSIDTQTSIVFDTTTEEGMKVSAPVTFQCGELGVSSSLEAFLQVRPMSSTASDTELKMTINGEQPGGVVRGYAGQNLDASEVNCLDNNSSLSFNQAFGPRLGAVTSNHHQETPLIWQLCRKGNEVPGLATGSALLVVNYK